MQTASLKQQIIFELDLLENLGMLGILWQFVKFLRQQIPQKGGNIIQVMAFAGCISDEEADDLRYIIATEFNQIEGDWA